MNECIIWPGDTDKDGYAMIYLNKYHRTFNKRFMETMGVEPDLT